MGRSSPLEGKRRELQLEGRQEAGAHISIESCLVSWSCRMEGYLPSAKEEGRAKRTQAGAANVPFHELRVR